MAFDKEFEKKFLKEDAVPSTPVYEIYANAAKKLWDSYHLKYDLRPRSAAKVPAGSNRSVNFYENNKHILEISIGKTTTIYVLDDYLRSKIQIEYNQDPSGKYRHTFDTFEECFEVIDDVLTKHGSENSLDNTKGSAGLFKKQLSKSGLDIKENWKGDPRDRFIELLQPLVDGSEYYLIRNTTDSSGKLLELYKNGESRRVMLFKGKQDMTVGTAFNGDFYGYIKQFVNLPSNQKAYRTQPHMDLSLLSLWNVICAATGKKQHFATADKTTVTKQVKEHPSPLDKYIFVKMIDAEKRVALVKSLEDGKNFVRKEYTLYNRNVFESLKKADIKGVPHIYECIEDKDRLVTIEEYIKGRNLDEILETEGIMDEEKMLHIALELCDILEQLHSLNPPMIHRDIKPSNIMIKETGEVVLIDFNASREHKEGYSQDTVLLGTKNFASPEQLMGFGDSDARTDIFGFGATMSYILTNMPINQMVAPGRYGHVFKKCVNMDKKDRYKNIPELRKALISA